MKSIFAELSMKRAMVLFGLLLVGCDAPPPASLPPVAPMKIELHDATYADLDRAVAARKGYVVVVDVWATFCAPCVKRFPHFVEMHEKFRDRGLVCISASTDAEEDKVRAFDFLKEKNAAFANYRFSESNEKIAAEWKEKYPTDIQPIIFVFNRKGEKVMTFEFKATAEQIDAYIDKLLYEK
jgi:thiol-disulfide isomerase/thioredoxin